MATRFTRLSLVAGDQQLDASLPAERPLSEFVHTLIPLFGLESTEPPTVWALSSPSHGVVAVERTLDDAGVLDGDVLYLSPAEAAAEPPAVDDVVTATATMTDDGAAAWAGSARDITITCLLSGVVLIALIALAGAPGNVLAGALVLAGFVLGVVLARLLRSRGGVVLGWTVLAAVPLAMVRLTRGHSLDTGLLASIAALLAGTAVVGLFAQRNRKVLFAGAVGAIAAAGACLIRLAGVSPAGLAGWAVPVEVLLLGVLPQLALSTSGLVGLVKQAEDGESVDRALIMRRARAGWSVVEGGVVALALTAAATAGVLIWFGRPAQAWLGGLLALIFTLRSRGFTRARQVGFLLAVPVVAALVAVAAGPRWIHLHHAGPRTIAWAAGAAVVGLVLAGTGYLRLGEVLGARTSRVLDRVDTVAVLVVLPLTLLAQNVFNSLVHVL